MLSAQPKCNKRGCPKLEIPCVIKDVTDFAPVICLSMAKRLKSGHILRIPLWHGWGFAYAKYLNVIGVAGNQSYPDIVKIFDCRSPTDEAIDLAKLHTYLMQPILFAGRLPTMRQSPWSIVGALPLLPEDSELPDLRVPESTIADRMIIYQQPRTGATLYTKNLDLRPQFETSIRNVEHLGFLSARGSGLIEISATMSFMLQEGTHPGDYFDLTDPRDKYEYQLVKSRPLANRISPHLYGRACQPGDPTYVPLQ